MLELTAVPFAARRQIMNGAELFFARGWPNNHFTLNMATRAGMGLVPPVYEGIGSEGAYFFSVQDSPTPVANESLCQLAASDVPPMGIYTRSDKKHLAHPTTQSSSR
jgi:hypothetical protein